jgi:hypothetical protein
MSNIDIEIEKLEKQLADLKKAKVEEDLCNKKGNFYISIFNNDNDEIIEDVKNRFQLLMN